MAEDERPSMDQLAAIVFEECRLATEDVRAYTQDPIVQKLCDMHKVLIRYAEYATEELSALRAELDAAKIQIATLTLEADGRKVEENPRYWVP